MQAWLIPIDMTASQCLNNCKVAADGSLDERTSGQLGTMAQQQLKELDLARMLWHLYDDVESRLSGTTDLPETVVAESTSLSMTE